MSYTTFMFFFVLFCFVFFCFFIEIVLYFGFKYYKQLISVSFLFCFSSDYN